MRKVLTVILAIFCIAPGKAQNYFFPIRPGAKLTYKHYDARGNQLKSDRKPMWTEFTVEEVWPEDNGDITINVLILNQHTSGPDAGKYEPAYIDNIIYGDVKIRGDSLILDNMHSQLLLIYDGKIPPKSKDVASVEITMDAACTLPRELKPGMELPDRKILDINIRSSLSEAKQQELANVALSVGVDYNQAINFGAGDFNMKRSIIMKKWRAEALEDVETPAGTFGCYKITYELEDKEAYGIGHQRVISIDPYAEWISPEIGLVKKVKYSRNGKKAEETMLLESYTE